MTKKEFMNLIDEYGFTLSAFNIRVGDFVEGVNGICGVHKNGDQWIFYDMLDCDNPRIEQMKNEEAAFEKLWTHVFFELHKYTNKSIKREMLLLPRRAVVDLLKREYGLRFKKAMALWACIIQDIHVLAEFKLYMIRKEFVPKEYAYKVCDYCVEQLVSDYKLDVLDAFRYMIHLKNNPQEAINELLNNKTKEVI